VAALGGPKAAGLFDPPTLRVWRLGEQIQVTWPATPGYLLQRSTDLAQWQDLDATLGLGSHRETIAAGPAFFRLRTH